MEMLIRPETLADCLAIRHVNEQAFGKPNEARIVEGVRESPFFIPELSLVAEHDRKIVGHILFSKGKVQGEGESWDLLALGPVAVSPSCQRQGVGSRLVQAGLERALQLGHRGVFLIGHPTYYPRFGFTPARTFGLGLPFEVPDEVFMALPLWPGAMDGVRGTVVYPPAFSGGD
jgi:putative acetyltransferase